jgi:DNA gyrase/topoisomerase IV subunit B
MLCFPGLKCRVQFSTMDPAVTGVLIGIGVMVCVGLSSVLHEKAERFLTSCKRRFTRSKEQPLLPMKKDNPVLVIRSKQFQMKQLLQKK